MRTSPKSKGRPLLWLVRAAIRRAIKEVDRRLRYPRPRLRQYRQQPTTRSRPSWVKEPPVQKQLLEQAQIKGECLTHEPLVLPLWLQYIAGILFDSSLRHLLSSIYSSIFRSHFVHLKTTPKDAFNRFLDNIYFYNIAWTIIAHPKFVLHASSCNVELILRWDIYKLIDHASHHQ